MQEGAREYLLNAVFKPEIWRDVRHICRVSRPGSACKQSDDASFPSDNDGAGIAGGGERAVFVAIRIYCDF